MSGDAVNHRGQHRACAPAEKPVELDHCSRYIVSASAKMRSVGDAIVATSGGPVILAVRRTSDSLIESPLTLARLMTMHVPRCTPDQTATQC